MASSISSLVRPYGPSAARRMALFAWAVSGLRWPWSSGVTLLKASRKTCSVTPRIEAMRRTGRPLSTALVSYPPIIVTSCCPSVSVVVGEVAVLEVVEVGVVETGEVEMFGMLAVSCCCGWDPVGLTILFSWLIPIA